VDVTFGRGGVGEEDYGQKGEEDQRRGRRKGERVSSRGFCSKRGRPLTTAVEIKLAEGDRGVDSVIIGIAEAELADPSEIGRVLEGANALHLVLEVLGGEVDVEGFDDAVDLLPLVRGEGGDGAAFERDDSVVLMSATEMSVR
jgi:hypothetical protein